MNAEGMTTYPPVSRTPHDSSLVRAGVLGLGIAVAVLLLAQGLVVHGPVLSGVGLAVFAVS